MRKLFILAGKAFCFVRMVASSITVMCYWNGKMTMNSRGITYEGAIPKAILVNSRIKYNELVDKIYALTGFDKNQFELKITCRYPGNNQEYIPFLVEDDNSVNVVLAATKLPGINCLEFYLEALPTSIDTRARVPSLTCSRCFTRLPVKQVLLSSCDFETSAGICVSEDQGSGEARLEHIHPTRENTVEDCSINVNCENATTEMVANEAHDSVLDGPDIVNDMLGFADGEEDEDFEHEEVDIACEDAPAPELADVERVHEVVADACQVEKEFSSPSYIGEFFVGQRFLTKKDLQNAVKAYSIKVHQEFVVAYSTANLWVVKCKQAPQCPWRLRASVPNGTTFFKIRKYAGPHACINLAVNRDHAQLDAEFIARHIKDLVKGQITITSASIQAEIAEKFNYDISRKKAWMAKQKAIVELFGERVKRTRRGRPKSARLSNEMDAGEGPSSSRCGLCKQLGHNKRRCPDVKL